MEKLSDKMKTFSRSRGKALVEDKINELVDWVNEFDEQRGKMADVLSDVNERKVEDLKAKVAWFSGHDDKETSDYNNAVYENQRRATDLKTLISERWRMCSAKTYDELKSENEQLKADKVYIVIGSGVTRMSVQSLIESYEELYKKYNDIAYIVCGDDEDEED